MEQERYEEKPQNLSESKAKTVPCDAKLECASSHLSLQSRAIDSECLANDYSTPTPQKISHTPRNQNKRAGISATIVKLFSNEDLNEDGASEDELVELADAIIGSDEVKTIDAVTKVDEVKTIDAFTKVDEVEIPVKYKPLAELFDRIDTSIRLLNMRKKLPTFQNICTVMKVLTQRILSYSDLAQIKYVLPEAINIEKILIHDKKTLCMVPDMKITFLLDVIVSDSNQSAFITLRQVFHQRLLDFSKEHPESSEIPVAMLPEPFNQMNHTDLPGHKFETPPTESAPLECESSSLAQSIRKHFSQKIVLPEMDKTLLLASPVPPFPVKFADKMDLSTTVLPQKERSLVSNSANVASPTVLLCSSQCSNTFTSESPLVKHSMLPHTLIVETPVQPTPAKRFSELSSCEKLDSETKVLSHTAAKRSLNFEESKQFSDCSLETEVTKSIHADDRVMAAPSLSLEAEENDNHNKSETGPVSHKQTPSSSNGLMNTIQAIFGSANGPLITKQELLQKIITINLDILDIGEAEEQLELLEEVVPDWIFRKVVPSGDLLYGIHKISDLESVRARLFAAA